MWTEYPVYGTDVQEINVFVANSTATPLLYGRSWFMYRWNGKEWVDPERKITGSSWEDDAFRKNKAPLLYCFRFPVSKYYHLSGGKYSIRKHFHSGKEKIELNAEFEVR